MMLLYAIKTHFRVDWGHAILSHMMSHDEYAEGLPYAYFLTKIFCYFNINLESELCFSMEKPSFMISIKHVNRKMGVIFNHRTHEIKYLENKDEEPQPEAHSDEDFNLPSEAQPDQPSNQMIMDYLQGFRTDVMTEIGHLSSRMNRWEFLKLVIKVVDIKVLLQFTKNIIVATAAVGCGANKFMIDKRVQILGGFRIFLVVSEEIAVGSGGEKGGLLDLSCGGIVVMRIGIMVLPKGRGDAQLRVVKMWSDGVLKVEGTEGCR
ncbi:hypothetical protein KIW84_022680 [Lathyrus oleraceus]|uniref:Uncharacterized protein n=1 Tax=Pisum sativum TaxID=3888 RepID=A0A9D5BBA7_PEA|nr:hypothetical protein KIW84_022680 [Pisum sativum]